MAAGQKPVKALWIRLTPTKTLSQKKPGWTHWVNASDNNSMLPATILTPLSTVISCSLVVYPAACEGLKLEVANLGFIYRIKPNISNY